MLKTMTMVATVAALAIAPTISARAGEPITATGPAGPLAGVLTRPAEGKPVILIVPGSGPTDRDGNNPMGVTAAPYRLLAEALEARGIGTIRIDKRGMFASAAPGVDPNKVTMGAYAEDVAGWVAAARAATGRDCIWLLGHSEGALVALVAAQRQPHLCGVITVAGPGRKLGEVLRAQLKANPANAPLLADALPTLDRLEAGERVDVSRLPAPLPMIFAPQIQDFLIDLFSHDPAALAASVPVPLMIVQGGADLQVPVIDGETLRAASPTSRYVLLPHMNHVLKDVPDAHHPASAASYTDPSQPVAPELVDMVASFVAPAAKEAR